MQGQMGIFFFLISVQYIIKKIKATIVNDLPFKHIGAQNMLQQMKNTGL